LSTGASLPTMMPAEAAEQLVATEGHDIRRPRCCLALTRARAPRVLLRPSHPLPRSSKSGTRNRAQRVNSPAAALGESRDLRGGALSAGGAVDSRRQ
jgi:hypothetical protein